MKADHGKNMENVQADRIAYLVAGYLRQTLSEQEHDELDVWITGSDANQLLFEELTDPVFIEKGLQEMDEPDGEAALDRIKKKLHFNTSLRKPNSRRIWTYRIAASLLLLVAAFFIYTVMNRQKNSHAPIAINKIRPGGDYAILTLANGKTINLKEAKNGLIDSSAGSEVLKTGDGQLSYENPDGRMLAYNILTTPAGGQYSVLLPDGSRVWLNASSSLRFPVAFTGKERVVELQGEGYFEIVPALLKTPAGGEAGGKKPFIVKINKDVEVEVVGTKFNINAYRNEPFIATTLLEGKVIMGGGGAGADTRELLPGEQGRAGKDGELDVEKAVHTAAIIAWTKGEFKFINAPIEEIMRQVSRWYAAEIVYEGKVDYHFNATIYRKEPVIKLLDILAATKRVRFNIEGNRIVVKP